MRLALVSMLLSFFCNFLPLLPSGMVMPSYHPPMLTILTENAPSDLTIEIQLHRRNGTVLPKVLEKKTRIWEQQFRLRREDFITVRSWYGNDYDLKDAELVLRSGGQSTTIQIPQELTEQMSMDDVLMLDYKTGTLSLGEPGWRRPLLLFLRILLAVGLELLVFRLRGYTKGRSLLTVGIVALVTIGLLSLYTLGWLNFNNRKIIIYILLGIVALAVQVITLLLSVEEHDRDHTLSTSVFASLAAVASNILWLYCFPI